MSSLRISTMFFKDLKFDGTGCFPFDNEAYRVVSQFLISLSYSKFT